MNTGKNQIISFINLKGGVGKLQPPLILQMFFREMEAKF